MFDALTPDDVVTFNLQVLGQALTVLDGHAAAPQLDFARISGPHLRHVIEHYEALLLAPPGEPIRYDERSRDRQVEQNPALARARIEALCQRLTTRAMPLDTPLTTVLRCGLLGDSLLATPSSLGRELMFLACHAIHHYAVIHGEAIAVGLPLPAHFGKAPATVHHEQQMLKVSA
jgi:hypothetical protein